MVFVFKGKEWFCKLDKNGEDASLTLFSFKKNKEKNIWEILKAFRGKYFQ